MDALLFFRELSSSPHSQKLPIFRSNMLYLQLGDFITPPLISVDKKAIVIEIVINLLRLEDEKILRKLNDCSFSLVREVLKIVVEPPKETAAHQ